MVILKLKKLYLSALSIVIAVLVLLVFISISTYRNLDRAERNAMDYLHQQGSDLIHVLSVAFEGDRGRFEDFIEQTAAGEDIAYVYLTDSKSIITHHSNPALIGTTAPLPVSKDAETGNPVAIRRISKTLRVYELAETLPGQTTIALGLKMTAFDAAKKADFHHALIMVGIVLALGAGAIFFFSVIHNYYSVEKTLEKTREQVQRAEKLAAIGKLAAGVAHEIRNPLSSIRGFAQFLGHTLKSRPEEKEYADIMVREIDRINRVVSDLLTYARPMALERARVDMPELVNHALRLVSADARSRNIQIVPHIPAPMDLLWVDAGQVTQALLNLLLNSLQAVGDGGRIEVGAGLDPADGLLHLWVEDDGRGIPAEHLDKILDPFFTTREKGTGLGLAIVQKIVENHQGELRIFSPVPGKTDGTRISMLIPGAVRKKEDTE